MGIFKSREERKIERDVQIRRGIGQLKRNIRKLLQHERDWLQKARRARRIQDREQVDFLKKQIKRTVAQRRLRERQLLALETAVQVKNQAEADVEFAEAMLGMSKAVAELYRAVDVAKIQTQFEQAMARAEGVKAQMDIFLEVINEQFTQEEVQGEEAGIRDEDIDRLLEEEAVQEERAGEDEISRGLKELEDEMGK